MSVEISNCYLFAEKYSCDLEMYVVITINIGACVHTHISVNWWIFFFDTLYSLVRDNLNVHIA